MLIEIMGAWNEKTYVINTDTIELIAPYVEEDDDDEEPGESEYSVWGQEDNSEEDEEPCYCVKTREFNIYISKRTYDSLKAEGIIRSFL